MQVSQHTETSHELQMRRMVNSVDWQCWHWPMARMFDPARRLAMNGKLTEAIQAAEDIQIANYGDTIGVEFRCVTKQTIVTSIGPMTDGWNKVN